MKRLDMLVRGMAGAASIAAVEEALRRLSGIESYRVALGWVSVTYHPAKTGVDEVEAAIEAAGFTVVGPAEEDRRLEDIFSGG